MPPVPPYGSAPDRVSKSLFASPALTVSAIAGLPFYYIFASRHPHNRDVQYRTVRLSLPFGVVLLAVVILGELRAGITQKNAVMEGAVYAFSEWDYSDHEQFVGKKRTF